MIESIKQIVIDKEILEKAQFVDLNKEKALMSAVATLILFLNK